MQNAREYTKQCSKVGKTTPTLRLSLADTIRDETLHIYVPHLIPNVIVPYRVPGELLQSVSLIILDDIDGKTSLTVVSCVVSRYRSARNAQSSANCKLQF